MTRHPSIAASLPLALAACGGGAPTVKAENASVAQVADAARDAVKMEPGKWRTTVRFVSIDAPNTPKQAADMMQQQMAKAGDTDVDTCVTPEMANKPPSEMLGGKAGEGCVYDSFELAGGKLDARMTCRQPNGGAVKSATSGSFTGAAYDLTSTTAVSGMPGAGAMTVTSQVSGKRLGACGAPRPS